MNTEDCGAREFHYFAELNGKGWVKCYGGKPELFTKTAVKEIEANARVGGYRSPQFVPMRVTYEIIKERS